VWCRAGPCWPAQPDYAQLVDGARLAREGRDFESFWERRRVASKTIRVVDDFDFVVLGIGVGAIPHTCGEILARDGRWRTMVAQVKTVATQAFQIWMREDMSALGWTLPTATISAFAQPFDTWADMVQTLEQEQWRTPRAVAYFCSVLPEPATPPDRSDTTYPQRRREEAKRNAIAFLNRDVGHLWPRAVTQPGAFRWELLVDPNEKGPPKSAAGPEIVPGPFRFRPTADSSIQSQPHAPSPPFQIRIDPRSTRTPRNSGCRGTRGRPAASDRGRRS
jgi:hypothetical protein